MFRAFKNLIFNTLLELALPGVKIEKDVSVNLHSVLKKEIVLGKKVHLIRGAVLSGKINIGNYSYINSYSELFAGDKYSITIGKFCSISRNVFIASTNNHNKKGLTTFPIKEVVYGDKTIDLGGDVKIGNDVWVGANAIILPGARIGDGAIVAAGAVVPEGATILPYEVWGGVPAKKIGDRFFEDTKQRLLELKWWDWSEAEMQANKQIFNSVVE